MKEMVDVKAIFKSKAARESLTMRPLNPFPTWLPIEIAKMTHEDRKKMFSLVDTSEVLTIGKELEAEKKAQVEKQKAFNKAMQPYRNRTVEIQQGIDKVKEKLSTEQRPSERMDLLAELNRRIKERDSFSKEVDAKIKAWDSENK